MTAVAHETPGDPVASPAPRRRDLTALYAIWSMAGVTVGALGLLYGAAFRPFSLARMDDLHLYGLSAPTLAAAAGSLAFGLLLYVARRAWAMTGAAICGALVTVGYYGASYALDQSLPLDLLSLGFVVIGLVSILGLVSAKGQLQSEPPKVLEVPVGGARVKNLGYTGFGLLMLFCWLLWFDFCWSIMETVLGPILQFRMANELNCDPSLYTWFTVTIPGIINFFLNPIISIKSDRHRGKRGRRIPFLLLGAPLVCGCLALMGFSNDIAVWIHGSFLSSMSLVEVTIWTIGILSLLFAIFNMFLGTTFYYLFNDVVPEEHFIKFMGYMRAVGTVAGMVYGWFIFGYSDKSGPLTISLGFWSYHTDMIWYPKLILVGAAVFYMAAATIALLKVREPYYPPPAPLAKGQGLVQKWGTTIQTIVKECFSHRFYVLYFITMMVVWMSYQMGQFQNPMRKAVGMDLDLLGKIGAVTGWVNLVLILATANYGDRFKPLPLMVFSMALVVVTSPVGLLFMIPGLSSETYFWIQIAFNITHLPINLILGMAEAPLAMSLMPNERYGQFAAAQSMMRMVFAGILGSWIAGKIMAWLKVMYGEYAFRYAFLWGTIFQVASLYCYYLLFKEWKKLGGRKSFKPPPVGLVSAMDVQPPAVPTK